MDIQFPCDQCGREITVGEDWAGQPCRCPNPECGCELTVPLALPPPDLAPPSDDITFECPSCQRELVVGREGAGQAVDCPACGASVVIPGASAPVPAILLEAPAPVWTPPPPPPPVPRRDKGVAEAPRSAMPDVRGMPALPAFVPPPARSDPAPGENKPAVVWLILRWLWRWLAGRLRALVAPGSTAACGAVGAEAFHPALRRLIQGVLLLLGLFALNWIVHVLLKEGRGYHRGMSLGDWTGLVTYVAIAGVTITLYRPVKTIAAFVLTRLVKSRKLPVDPKGLDSLVAVVGSLLLLGFFVLVYFVLLPRITLLNVALLHFGSLTTVLNVLAILGVLGILVRLWRNSQPLIDLLTAHLAARIAEPGPDPATPEPPVKEGEKP